jgi:hypothetical protein
METAIGALIEFDRGLWTDPRAFLRLFTAVAVILLIVGSICFYRIIGKDGNDSHSKH